MSLPPEIITVKRKRGADTPLDFLREYPTRPIHQTMPYPS